jgi:tol-pal system protein YbgF
MHQPVTIVAMAAFIGLLSVSVYAATATDARLDRIERQLDSRGLVDMSNRIEQLQRDVQQLRGEIEVQNHTLEEMRRRQKELYLDTDRRLRKLEAAPSIPAATAVLPVETVPASGAESGVPAAMPPPVPAPSGQDEKAAYDMAYALLNDRRYPDAAKAFGQFVTAYPQSEYTDNARYWLGETYLVMGGHKDAMNAFNELVKLHPESDKVPGARLKIGYIYYENENWAAARKELSALIADYPDTTVAREANSRLQRMKKEGR